jgi:hypothetical protein
MLLELIPAYGRTYATEDEARAAWENGHDFQIPNGPYCNKQDAERFGAEVILHFGENNLK